jgi:hypothetical protein
MAPKTVQELFNLKPEELNALTVLSGLEGFRGGQNSPDVAAVAANVLARRLKGNWGGVDVRNIATAPGQYEAVKGYNMQQLADPAFGAKVLGGKSEFNRLRNIVNNPQFVGEQFRRSKGAQSFKGTSAYGSRRPGDYMPVPGQSNFYHDPLDPQTLQKGLQLFNRAGSSVADEAQAPTSPRQKGNILGGNFLQGILKNMVPAVLQQRSALDPQDLNLGAISTALPMPQQYLSDYMELFS